jgi:uncharacterized damage-inducible protein DinB
MAIKDGLLPEYDHEMATTRRLLDRVPEADLAWRPHDKSMALGELAGHIANIPWWCQIVLERPAFDVSPGGVDLHQKAPVSVAELLSGFDAKVTAARTALAAASDAEMQLPWTLKHADQEVFTMPRAAVLRSFVLNHLIHHRGQLSVYLRLKNVAVPPIYGPTADEA